MVAIHTSEDIIRALREDPDLLDQVRRAVMTDEVLALPGQFAAMLETQNRMLDDIADLRQTQNRILDEQASLRQTQNAMLGDIADLRQTQNRILDEQASLRQTQNAMLETQNRMLGDIADLRQTQNAMLDDIADLRQTQNRILDEQASLRQTQNAMLETQNRMLGDIADLRQTQNRILDEQASLRQTQNELLETQNEILRRLGNLETRFGRLEHDYGNFRGNYAENAARKRAPSIAMYLDESKNLGIDELTISVLSGPDILALAGEYGSDRLASIPRETRRSFYEADLIIRADKTDGSTFYISVEASYTCDGRDTTRAMSHSRLITEFTGREAWPAIAGVRVDRNIKPLISSGEVFWFALEDDDLEP